MLFITRGNKIKESLVRNHQVLYVALKQTVLQLCEMWCDSFYIFFVLIHQTLFLYEKFKYCQILD